MLLPSMQTLLWTGKTRCYKTETSVMDKKSFVPEKSVNVLKTFLYLSLIF
jgi:hypothetical protein